MHNWFMDINFPYKVQYILYSHKELNILFIKFIGGIWNFNPFKILTNNYSESNKNAIISYY